MLYFAGIGGTEVDETEESGGLAINGHDVDQQSDEGFQSGAESVLGLTWRFTLLFSDECVIFLWKEMMKIFRLIVISGWENRLSSRFYNELNGRLFDWLIELKLSHPILKVLVSTCFPQRPEHSKNSFRSEKSRLKVLWRVLFPVNQ